MKSEILIIAGEASADLHAASMIEHLKSLDPELSFFGMGGKLLKDQGMEITVPSEKVNVVGFTDWFNKLREVFGAYNILKAETKKRKPVLAVLLDLPDFNLRMARQLHKRKIPIVYYISPQVWAWRSYRVRTIKKYILKMLVVFPFEKIYYEKKLVDVDYVGHPLLDQITIEYHPRAQAEILKAPRIALLPGSRNSELDRHFELLKDFCLLIRKKYSCREFRVLMGNLLH
jgi:lipid-A-disaccharide synthase